jgi:glycosyltransferase involved in cell wall biosynthesis
VAASSDIVIPVYNEAETVGALLDRLRVCCPDALLVVVDNGSTDGTLALLEARADIRLLRHDHNLGYGRSILDGIAASDGARIVVIDADLEYQPEDVPAVLRALDTSAAVYGSRFLGARGGSPAVPLLRVLGNRLVTGVFNLLFRQRLTDLYTGLRGVRRSAVEFGALTSPGFEMVLELSARLAQSGVQIAEVPVQYVPRSRGRSKMRHVREFLKFAYRIVVLRLTPPPRTA